MVDPDGNTSPQLQSETRPKAFGGIGFWIRLAVAVCSLGLVLVLQDWAQLRAAVVQLRPGYLGLALGIYMLAQLVQAFRWWILVRALGIHSVSVGASIRLLFLGLFYNNLMPSAIGGDVLRAWYVARHTDKKVEAAVSVLVDRVIGLLGTLIMAMAAIAWTGALGRLLTGGSQAAHAAGASSGAWVGAGIALAALAGGLLASRRGRLVAIVSWIRSQTGRGLGALGMYLRNPLALAEALVLTVVLQAGTILAYWGIGLDLGMQAGVWTYFVVFPLTWVLSALPISVAGIGILEGGITALFVCLGGATKEQAVALALCQRMIWVVGSLPGVFIHMAGRHLPQSD